VATNNNNNTNTKQKSSTKSIWSKSRPYYIGSGKLGTVDILGQALDAGNNTSLYYDPTTGTYIDRDAAKSQLWEKNHPYLNVIYDSYDSGQYAEDLLAQTGVENPYALWIAHTAGSLAPYALPVYGVTKMANDVGKNISENIFDYNRDIDMIKDLRYGDMGYSIKYLEDNELAPIWEGIKTSLANDWLHDLTGLHRRTGFSEQSDVYKLGQQTTIKMMQKMLEDTGNFDPANAKSRVTLNQFNMMNQLLKNSDAYWQLQSIKNSQDMNDDDFYAYLNTAGIDENTYKGMEYAAKQLYNLGDNQERNGLRYDPKFNFSTNTPMLQYTYARKQKPIQNDPLAGLVGGSNVLDGYTKVGDNFVDIKTGEKLVPEIDSENQNTTTDAPTTTATQETTTPATATANDTKENTVNTVQDTPNYVKAGFYEFPQEYARRTGYNFANNPYNIWK
jgi:hypothetical protein